MPDSPLTVDGKCFRAGPDRWWMRGISYGPLPGGYADSGRFTSDLDRIRALGCNTVRVYDIPPPAFFEGCAERGLRVFVTPPWPSNTDFLCDHSTARSVRHALDTVVRELRPQPALAGYFIGNEIPAPLVRWMGPGRVLRFLEQCLHQLKNRDPDRLFAYANYPSTEYLQPAADFLACNLYLEERTALRSYLRRLQLLAGSLPLVISEFGLDSLRGSEDGQASAMQWMLEETTAAGCAGAVVFSYTDDWFNAGQVVQDWAFGLFDRERRPKAGAEAVRRTLESCFPPPPPGPEAPLVSVIVCSRGGHDRLPSCLQALQAQTYPHVELLVVDDGSEPPLAPVVAAFPGVDLIRVGHSGLGAARNAGAAAARGSILAFTDDDCQPDPMWIDGLVREMQIGGWEAVGGPNLPPPEAHLVARTIQRAPGHPSHVMLTDDESEHLAGCNFAVLKTAFQAVGGFHPVYRTAGDDVDFCWRLRDAGMRLGFAPAAFVWHRRRPSCSAYLQQQIGYGIAESLLFDDHRGRFDGWGRTLWVGRLYGDQPRRSPAAFPVIYFGRAATAPYQFLYSGAAGWAEGGSALPLSFPWAALAAAFLAAGLILPPFLLVGAGMLSASLAMASLAARSSTTRFHPGGAISPSLLAALILLQGWSRGAAFWWRRLQTGRTWQPFRAEDCVPAGTASAREIFLRKVVELEEPSRPERRSAWSLADLSLRPGPWTLSTLATVEEHHPPAEPLLRVRLASGPQTLWLAAGTGGFALTLLLALAGHFLLAAVLAVLNLVFFGCLFHECRQRHRTLWTSIQLAAASLRSAPDFAPSLR